MATNSSGVTLTPWNSGIACTFGRSSIVGVMSRVMNSVTCGAVKALSTTAAALCLRTPLIGMRRSRVAGSYDAAVSPGAVTPAAPSTSSRVMMPRGPLPRRAVRSTPRSLASLRTGGLASTSGAAERSAAAWPTCSAETRAGAGGAGAGAAAGPALRARRFAVTDRGP